MQPFSFFLLFAVGRGRGDFGSGSGFKFNCAARVGSGQTISGTVRASVLSPCRPLEGILNTTTISFNCCFYSEGLALHMLHRQFPVE